MKLSIAVVASLVGMIGSSIGVSWAMGPARASEPIAIAPRTDDSTPTSAAVAAVVGTKALEPGSASFVREGVLRVEGRVGHAVLPEFSLSTWLGSAGGAGKAAASSSTWTLRAERPSRAVR